MGEPGRKIEKRLADLAQLDRDAARACERALRGVDRPDLHARLVAFVRDHDRHAEELSAALRVGGEAAPEEGAALRGRLLKGVSAVRAAMGTSGALAGAILVEATVNRAYDAVLADPTLPADTRPLVRAHWEEVKRHLRYLEQRAAVPLEVTDA